MPICPTFEASGAYVTGLTAFIDCRVEVLGREGYLALATGGSPLTPVIGGLLTILIALLGYRLLLGETLRIRDGVMTAVRIGIVLALATQWPAYQALVYDVVIDGPGELASIVTNASGASADGIPARIQASYDVLEALAHPPIGATAPATTEASTPAAPQPLRLALTSGEQSRLSASSVILLLSSLAGMLSVRIVAGFMLALGPLFAACLLFDGMRGLFEGWVRVLAGAAFGSIAATITLGLELAVLEPQLIRLLDAAQNGDVPPTAVVEIFVTTLLFSAVIIAAILAAGRAAAGFRMAASIRIPTLPAGSAPSQTAGTARPALQIERDGHDARTRAAQIADGIRAIQYRESVMGGQMASNRRIEMRDNGSAAAETLSAPLGQSHRRRLTARRFASSIRRDRRA